MSTHAPFYAFGVVHNTTTNYSINSLTFSGGDGQNDEVYTSLDFDGSDEPAQNSGDNAAGISARYQNAGYDFALQLSHMQDCCGGNHFAWVDTRSHKPDFVLSWRDGLRRDQISLELGWWLTFPRTVTVRAFREKVSNVEALTDADLAHMTELGRDTATFADSHTFHIQTGEPFGTVVFEYDDGAPHGIALNGIGYRSFVCR
ncbi:MAG: hypothetical protein AAFS10_03140 [Myxococcota bacterium]